jgi:uncharacterized membrane protein
LELFFGLLALALLTSVLVGPFVLLALWRQVAELRGRLREVEARLRRSERVEPAERGAADGPVAPVPTEPSVGVESAVPPQSPPTPAQESAPQAAPQPSVPQPARATPQPAPRPEPRAARAPRPGISWEQWIGVRGAGLLGGAVGALAAIYLFVHAVQEGWLSPPIRVGAGIAVGIVAFVASEWLRPRNYHFVPDGLLGLGATAWYAAAFAGGELYGLWPQWGALLAMVLTTAATFGAALQHRSTAAATLALLGGFATPLLLAGPQDRPLTLFGYLLVLDLGLLVLTRALGRPALAAAAWALTALFQFLWLVERCDERERTFALAMLALFALLFTAGVANDPRARRWWRLPVPLALGLAVLLTTRFEQGPSLWWLAAFAGSLAAGASWFGARSGDGLLPFAASAGAAAVVVVRTWHGAPTAADAPALAATVACVGLAPWLGLLGTAASWAPTVRGVGVLGAALTVLVASFELGGSAFLLPSLAFTALAAIVLWRERDAVAEFRAGVAVAAAVAGAAVVLGRESSAVLEELRAGGTAELGSYWAAAGAVFAWPLLIAGRRRRLLSEAPDPLAGAAVLGLAMALPAALVAVGLEGEFPALPFTVFFALIALAGWILVRGGRPGWALVFGLTLWSSAVSWSASRPLSESYHSSGELPPPTPAHWAPVLVLAFAALVPLLAPACVARLRHSTALAVLGPLLGVGTFWSLSGAAFLLWRGSPEYGVGLFLAGCAWLAYRSSGTRAHAEGTATDRPAVARPWLATAGIAGASLGLATGFDFEPFAATQALLLLGLAALWPAAAHPLPRAIGAIAAVFCALHLAANLLDSGHYAAEGVAPFNRLGALHLLATTGALGFAWRTQLKVVGGAGLLLAFVTWNAVLLDWLAEGPQIQLPNGEVPRIDLTLSIAWALFSLGLLVLGVLRSQDALRWTSLAVLLATAFKVFLHDLGDLTGLARVGSLAALGLSLISVSLLYQRFVFRRSAV